MLHHASSRATLSSQEVAPPRRTPIREALLRLERAGLVIAQPGKATLVAPYDRTSTENAQQVVAAMHELAARLAVPIISARQLDSMQAAADRFASALDAADVERALSADDGFHRVFVEASGNETIAEVLDDLTPVLRRVERMRFSSFAARESVAQHDEIIRLARASDAEAAALACRENWLTLSYTAG